MKERSFSLLTKTTSIYLVFTFLAFYCSALFLTHEADEYINYEMERRFGWTEQKVLEGLRTDKDYIKRDFNTIWISKAGKEESLEGYPTYETREEYHTDVGRMVLHRVKTVVLEVDGQHYFLVMSKEVEHFLRFKEDIFDSMLPAFMILAAIVVLFNYILSGYFFYPFRLILDSMKSYQLGKKYPNKKIQTSTKEFQKMQQLYFQMVDRIEKDFHNLQEYTENMAHEIQTPLAIIRNKTEYLMMEEEVMSKHPASVKAIYDEANHLSKLGSTLNLLTKIENREFSNTVKLQTAPVILKHIEAVRELAGLKSMEIEADLFEQHYLEIDPYLFEIILKNFFRNAIRYGTSEGPIRVATTANEMVISNYGEPLDVEPEKVFERFFRKGTSQQSVGLGLALVKKICTVNGLKVAYEYTDHQHHFTIVK
ncbi:HAMP domain-containing sensor histidine kinase [Limibacter armeniacum]|uniref:sensor histidine kinase n=1 Tax=Limibacter armeniacum TaxID=466084 RepID=UPI002FE577C2